MKMAIISIMTAEVHHMLSFGGNANLTLWIDSAFHMTATQAPYSQ